MTYYFWLGKEAEYYKLLERLDQCIVDWSALR
jgi:hypothetical protein